MPADFVGLVQHEQGFVGGEDVDGGERKERGRADDFAGPGVREVRLAQGDLVAAFILADDVAAAGALGFVEHFVGEFAGLGDGEVAVQDGFSGGRFHGRAGGNAPLQELYVVLHEAVLGGDEHGAGRGLEVVVGGGLDGVIVVGGQRALLVHVVGEDGREGDLGGVGQVLGLLGDFLRVQDFAGIFAGGHGEAGFPAAGRLAGAGAPG